MHLTHLTLKCRQLSGKLRDIYALKLKNEAQYKAQLDEALFARPVLHADNLYNVDGMLLIKSESYCSIKSNAFQNFAQLSSLIVSSRKIEKIEANSFMELSQLIELKLIVHSNSLVMDTNAFNGLENLERLDISVHLSNDNTFKLEGLSFANFKQLKHVNLGKIALTSISDHLLCEAQGLESIDLNNNNLNSISIYGIQGLNKLKSVCIIFNEIENLNLRTFANHPCLNKVSLFANKIKRVENKREDGMPQDGYFFPKLEEIDLSHNLITHFMPDTFIQLEHLIKLNLSSNHLTEIQASTFRGLRQLDELNLSFNQIKTIEAGSFDELSNLKELNLRRNELTTLDANLFCTLSQLKTLNVEANNLDKKSEDMLLKLQNTGISVQYDAAWDTYEYF